MNDATYSPADQAPLAWAAPAPKAPSDWTESLGARAVLALALLGLVCACGSGGATSNAKSADDAEESASESDAGSSDSEADDSSSEEAEASSAAPQASCDGSECFRCGAGMCLKGWYCDEGAQGGAACSWLPECANKASCGCVTRALGDGCSCKEEDGAAHVTCR